MRSYLSSFFNEFDYPSERAKEFLSTYDKIRLNPEASGILDGILAEYDASLEIKSSILMPKCERIAELITVHPHTVKLFAHICLSHRLRRYYAKTL